jgi:phage antirepressor YoqD-like protein
LTEILATTNIISLKRNIYRFDFPSIDTYTGGFATDDSITQIVGEGDIVIEDANFIPLMVEITGDIVVEGDLTAENLIVGSTNVITEITALQSLTATHTEDLATNTADILTKQNTITTATDLDCNSLTTGNLEVNGSVHIDTSKYFDTIVIRRPTGITGRANDYRIGLRELQTWVNGVNIMIDNGLTSYFALWTDKETDIGFTNVSTLAYNNIIESTTTGEGAVSPTSSVTNINNALIIKNIPLTSINTIQSLVLYNRVINGTGNRTIGLAIELYNSINDPDLTEVLATTNVITSDVNTYRFDFPSLSTYTGSFATADSTTLIIDNSVALVEDAIFTDYSFEITGDVIANGVNINTTLADILSRLELLENT